MIIIFSNQKGGCGKTTLATAFSFYLSSKGHLVTVFDTDEQQSLFQMHQMDIAHFDNSFLFDVQYINVKDKDSIDKMFAEFSSNDNKIAVVDSSGVLDFNNLFLASRCDNVIVPFSFDQKTLPSTLTWLKSYSHFKFDESKIIVLANRIKSTVKKDALEKAKVLISGSGYFVCNNNVPDINSINLLTTVALDKQTHERTADAFNEMYLKIFNK